MAYGYEFPHSSQFDSDLREILEMYCKVKQLPEQYAELKTYVDNYFKNLNISTELESVLDTMLNEGKLEELMAKTYAVYMSLESAINSNVNGEDGTYILVMSANGYVKPSVWRMASNGVESILQHKTKGKWIVYAETICDVGALGLKQYPIDTTVDINTILSSEFKEIHFPPYHYSFTMEIDRSVSLIGSGTGTGKTKITHPTDNFYDTCVSLNANYIYISNIHFVCLANNDQINGFVVNRQCDYSVFENIRIENFATAFLVNGRFIWNILRNAELVGSFYAGLYMATTEPVNTNEFYSCVIDDNVQYGVYLDLTGLSFNNTFYGCTIEGNGNSNFGMETTVSCAIYVAAFANFINCYFENNGVQNTVEDYAVFKVFNFVNVIGSSFIIEQRDLFWLVNDAINCNLIGCYQYGQTGNTFSNEMRGYVIGSNFIN